MGSVSDQILPMGNLKTFSHQLFIGGIAVLNQSPLDLLLVGISGDIDLLPGQRMDSRVIHTGESVEGVG